MVETSLIAVFLIGLFGGVHCAGMCGGIVTALGLVAQRPPARTAAPRAPATAGLARNGATTAALGGVPVVIEPVAPARASPAPAAFATTASRVLVFNLARVSTYALLGAAAGALGSLGMVMDRLLPVQQAALVLANLMLLVMGFYILGARALTRRVEALGTPLWRRVQPRAAAALARADTGGLALAGALWGLIPCGMVYTVLVASLTTGTATDGAALMAAFGLGTLPNLMLMGVSAAWFTRLRAHRWLRGVVGGLLIAFALAGLFRIDAVLSLPLIGELCFRPVP